MENQPKDLKTQFEDAVVAMLSFQKQIREELAVLEESKKAWTELQSKLKENAAKANTKIKISVGGQVFATSKSTLLSIEGTYFHAMLSSGHWQPDEDGEYFIDRSPKCFRNILDYLLTGKLDTSPLTSSEKKQLTEDLDYYQIKLPKMMWSSGDNTTINGSIVTKSGVSGWNCGVIGNVCDPASYKLKILNRPDGAIMVGLSPTSNFKKNASNYSTSGWYMHLNGSLYSQNGDSGRGYQSAVNNNSIIEVLYDKNNKTISFRVNDAAPSVAFTNVPNNVYPALDIHTQNASVELISIDQ